MSHELCGAWPEEGGCILPRGHNMGNADIPANHEFPIDLLGALEASINEAINEARRLVAEARKAQS